MKLKVKGKTGAKVTFYCDDHPKKILSGTIIEINVILSETIRDVWYRIEGPEHKSDKIYVIRETELISWTKRFK